MGGERCDLLCLDLPQAEALRAMVLPCGAAEAAAERARALADPTRLTVISALGQSVTSELCVCDLSWIAERSEQLVGHHLRVLRRAGLVRSRRDGKMVLYQLTASGRRLLDAVLEPAQVAR